MPAFTTTQPGNWSDNATWGGSGHPGSGDTATTGHAVTVDVDTVCDGLTMNAGGHVTVATTKKLTVNGTLWEKDATIQLNAGAKLWGNGKFLQGSANSQLNCRIVALGNGGSICEVKAAVGGTFYVDGGEEGSGLFGNCGGWDVTYCNLIGLGHPTLPWSIRSNDYGLHHRRFIHCTFDNCKTQFAVTNNWGASGDKDWRVEFCKWINQPAGATGMRYVFGDTGLGTKTFEDCSVGEPADAGPCMTFAGKNVTAKRTYFDSSPSLIGQANCNIDTTCVVRESSNTQTCSLYWADNKAPCYLLCDHVDPANRVFGTTHVGNPHVADGFSGGTISDVIIEYPGQLLVDGGDGLYGKEDGSFALTTIQRCLVLPSMTDGYAGANLTPMVQQNNRIKVYHCTVVGRNAFLVFNERLVNGTVPVAEAKSNLIAGVANSVPSGFGYTNDSGWIGFCVFEPGTDCGTDSITPAGIKNNYVYKGGVINAGPPGASKGVFLRQSASPDGTNIFDDATGPQFVDQTRNAARWAVHKGYVGAEPTQPALPVSFPTWNTWFTWKRDALDAVRTALMADPTLGSTDLAPWVRDGFAPQNVVLQNAGHDGLTIGAIPFAGGAPPPPPPTGVALVCARQAAVYVP